MSRLFISHSSANNAIALALGQWLESQGWSDYFLDVHADRGIAPGERWMAALTGAVDRCEAVLFVVSKAWLTSDYCKAELYWAKGLGKRLFGLIVEPIDPSDLPVHVAAEWQVCDLCHADEPVTFSVERPPLLPRTDVAFPKAGLDALARGLRKAGLDPATFEWPPAAESDRSPYPGLRAQDRADLPYCAQDCCFGWREQFNEIRLIRALARQGLPCVGQSPISPSEMVTYARPDRPQYLLGVLQAARALYGFSLYECCRHVRREGSVEKFQGYVPRQAFVEGSRL